MKYEREIIFEYHPELPNYLHSWGLREFQDEASYYEWQRSFLSDDDLRQLHQLIEHRQGGAHVDSDIEFYDVLARPDFVPVFYSQRFHYFLVIGSSIERRLIGAKYVLDFGCGAGILSIFYAQQHPDMEFLGIDRSPRSIERARFEATKRQLPNICFEVSSVPQQSISGKFDLILSTQALFQAERDPGLPSRSWRTFQRVNDSHRQGQLEIQTGLQGRLNSLLSVLFPKGRMLIFEKTWHLGRRIFLQRALEARGVRPISPPVFCRYRSIDEEVTDGPLYDIARVSQEASMSWDEDPYSEPGETLYRCAGGPAEWMGREMAADRVFATVSGVHRDNRSWMFRFGLWKQVFVWGLYETLEGFKGLVIGGEGEKDLLLSLVDTVKRLQAKEFEQLVGDFWGKFFHTGEDPSVPCYENHHPSAQKIYEALPSRHIQLESTVEDGEGRESHIELGTTHRLVYLYRANTFDQRQLVVMDEKRAHLLQQLYREPADSPQTPSAW